METDINLGGVQYKIKGIFRRPTSLDVYLIWEEVGRVQFNPDRGYLNLLTKHICESPILSVANINTMCFSFLSQQHPFFTLHESKATDVASFVKLILGD